MADNEAIGPSNRKYIRQPPSVPFLWEEKPGIAKKNWQPVVSPVTTLALPSPVKLIASVPFDWEEKPGKPLPCFSDPPPPQPKLASPSPPPMYSCSQNNDHKSNNGESCGYVNYRYKEGIFDTDIESFSFATDDSVSFEPSLLANCLISSVTVSSAVPVLKTSSSVDINDELEIATSPVSETDSTTSSYATGISSLAGASFLECLFPLYSPRSGFLGKHACSRKGYFSPSDLTASSFHYGSDCNTMTKKTPTLGELIMMSRRRSYQRKAIQMGTQNLSMEFFNKKAFSCCIFGTGMKMIEGSQRKRHHLLRLKLI